MKKEFAVDNISILFLARMCKTHTNSFRCSMTLKEPIRPELLQTAVNKIWKRFPSIIAAFRPGFSITPSILPSSRPRSSPTPACWSP